MAVITQSISSIAGHIRQFDVTRDLNPVADLVELCFADTMDPDGERYLRQMRDAARNTTFLRWANAVADQSTLPMSGLVWEEDEHVVGNLSLIPFSVRHKRFFLIANVAVHPDYRRRGIARALTTAAQDQARHRGSSGTWLHVREDNEPAVRLYLSLGFKERARRTTWQANHNTRAADPQDVAAGNLDDIQVVKRASSHWLQQSQWLADLYPVELSWHLPINIQALGPGLISALRRLASGIDVENWAVLRGGRLQGTVSWQSFQGYTDYLWLSVSPVIDDTSIYSLLVYARRQLSDRRPLCLDFPARLAGYPIQAAGFKIHQTLIWMEAQSM
jgi:ribosomal protein S18 acetylase RimI-like enzyme